MAFVLLPSEIILHIANYSSLGDVINFSKTCKFFYQLLETHPWRDINLHAESDSRDHGRKEQTSTEDADSNFDEDDDEQTLVVDTYYKITNKTSQFIEACASKRKNTSAWTRCSAAVRSLHITLNGHVPAPWAFILSFTNLETICANGRWLWSRYITDLTTSEYLNEDIGIPESLLFPYLKSVKLREYIPSDWARKLLNSAPSLTELDIAALAPPLDPPISKWGDLPKGAYLSPNNLDALWLPTVEKRDEDEDEDEDGYLGQELSSDDCIGISPLPLSLSVSNFTSITHMRLCKPSARYDVGEMDQVSHNLKLEKAVLEEWVELLRVVRPTLEELVLDLRPVVRDIWCDGMAQNTPVRKHGRELGDERFVEVVLVPVFFEDNEGWPRLKKVRLSGVEIEDLMFGGQTGMGRRRFERRLGPKVQVTYTPGMYSFIRDGEDRTGEGYLL